MPLLQSLTAILAIVALLPSATGRSCRNPLLVNSTTGCSLQYPGAANLSVDALIIGGGSSGSNAAIHLLDSGLSVLVVEKQAQLVRVV